MIPLSFLSIISQTCFAIAWGFLPYIVAHKSQSIIISFDKYFEPYNSYLWSLWSLYIILFIECIHCGIVHLFLCVIFVGYSPTRDTKVYHLELWWELLSIFVGYIHMYPLSVSNSFRVCKNLLFIVCLRIIPCFECIVTLVFCTLVHSIHSYIKIRLLFIR